MQHIPFRAYFQEIEDFIELHKNEPDFSFNSTTEPTTGEDLVFTTHKITDTERTLYEPTIPQVLYWDYWSEDNPKYSLTYYLENNRLEVK